MRAHIFLVNRNNFSICMKHGVYGCVASGNERQDAEIIAGLMGVRHGDLIFFYVVNTGLYGSWRVIDAPFFDETPVWPNPTQKYPFRFRFEPAIRSFTRPISFLDLLDLRDRGLLWTFDLGTKTTKNQYSITADEARELLRLLVRNNPVETGPAPVEAPYVPQTVERLAIPEGVLSRNSFQYEGWLNAWFMRSLGAGELTSVFGTYRDYLNLVPTSFNKVMDVFLTHTINLDGVELLSKFTCIELKAGRATETDLSQTLLYERWLTRRLGHGDPEMVQTFIVARSFAPQVVDYVQARSRVEERALKLLSYRIDSDRTTVSLSEVGGVAK